MSSKEENVIWVVVIISDYSIFLVTLKRGRVEDAQNGGNTGRKNKLVVTYL